jgi:hypothetical protein
VVALLAPAFFSATAALLRGDSQLMSCSVPTGAKGTKAIVAQYIDFAILILPHIVL